MRVIVMYPVLTIFVMGLMFVLVLGVLVALLGGVLALWSMRRAWLETADVAEWLDRRFK
jgi:hypothetical protein